MRDEEKNDAVIERTADAECVGALTSFWRGVCYLELLVQPEYPLGICRNEQALDHQPVFASPCHRPVYAIIT